MEVVSINKASPNDVSSIVAIHQQAFRNFFLTSLGKDFLELYYSSFIVSDASAVICARRGEELIGFAACSYRSLGFNKTLIKKHLFRFGIEALKLLFKNPKALIRLAKNLNKEGKNNTIKDLGQYAELYSIAVSPNFQGGGVGRKLLTAIEADVKSHNSQISLTTDYYHNDKTIAFYHSMGYNEYYDFVTYPNRRMWRMIKNI